MIHGFDDNKNKVKVPDANFKIIDYAYNTTSNSSNNPLILNVGEAVITNSLIFYSYGYETIYTSEEEEAFCLIIKIVPREDGPEIVSYTCNSEYELNGIISNVYTYRTRGAGSPLQLHRYGLDYNYETKIINTYNIAKWFILRIA